MKPSLIYGVVRLGVSGGWSRLCSFQALRACSDGPAGSAGSAGSVSPLRQWTVAVSPFLRVRCRVGCNVSVRALDPHAFPEADRALITLHARGDGQELKEDTVQVHYDDQSKELQITSDQSSSDISVELTTPIKSDLHIVTLGKGDVKIQNMESDLCLVQTEQGHCVLKSLKSHKVQVKSSGGNITGIGTIHGDVDISAVGDSSIDVKKIQGTTMNVSTENGPLRVKAVYAGSSSMVSSSGEIHIGHLHGEACVRSDKGDLIIDSSSGALTAITNAGNIDVYVDQTGTAELHTQQGAVCVRVPATMKGRVQLCGTSVDISSEKSQETMRHSDKGKTVVLAQLNGGTEEDGWIKATADRSAVSLKTQSWFETLKLGS